MIKKAKEPIYTLDLTLEKCFVRAFVNDFPVTAFNATSKSNISIPLNAYLAGGKNKLSFEILPPILPIGEMSLVTDLKISGGIKSYENYSLASPDEGDIELEINESNFDLSKFPITAEMEFENYGPRFRELFYITKPYEDEDALKDYGMKLRALAQKKDLEGLVKEFEPKLSDFARAYYDEPEDYVAEFREYMSSYFFPQKPVIDFIREQLYVKSWCGKRIWEIGVLPDEELLQTEPDKDNKVLAVKIYVANLKNGLKVVR